MTWGGKREGAGRKVGWRKENPEQRPRRGLVAFDDKWQLIKKFADAVKHGDKSKCKKFIDSL